ncbi:MAG: glycosyltransferase [Pseudomonadota bacterium]
MALVTIVIRTLNEATHLGALLKGIAEQDISPDLTCEVVLVDSGSTDGTLEIAEQFGCNILHISREEFSFGRSLNLGCAAAKGEVLVIISGHCVPTNGNWLRALCAPILEGKVQYSYGRQIGGPESYYSECRIFAKYFGSASKIPQQGYYCNNANSAVLKSSWERYGFNEELTGLEDMALAKQMVADGASVAYVAEACVYHYHNETWRSVERRFSREAIALQYIMPQIHIRKRDLFRYIASSIWLDWRSAASQGVFLKRANEIVQYRVRQYWGSYKGNHDHRTLSHTEKEVYFYPDQTL